MSIYLIPWSERRLRQLGKLLVLQRRQGFGLSRFLINSFKVITGVIFEG